MLSIIYSERFLEHDTGSYHPEKPARLTAIKQALECMPGADKLAWLEPTPVEEKPEVMELTARVHGTGYLEGLKSIGLNGGGMLDADTIVSPNSYDVALLAVSAWLDGVDRVMGNPEPAFVLARPPGHHATRKRGMGFCLFSNAAIAALHALDKYNLQKVAIVDWDVHHGNGTQDIVGSNPNIAYCSLHQSPCYPYTGRADETGFFNNVLNIPLPADSNIGDYREAFETKVIPFLKNFRTELIIISAGYDANKADPLAGICLNPEDYGLLTRYLKTFNVPLLFGLEGGYDLEALSLSVVATLEPFLT